jgi:hypothetical protein
MITIKRFYDDDCTFGRMTIAGFHCWTLELRDLDNQQSISCIPEAVYRYEKITSSKNGLVLELKNVEHRSHIQIHNGNYTANTKGCILVGDGIKHINHDNIPDVTNSTKTLVRVLNKAGDSGKIRIYS